VAVSQEEVSATLIITILVEGVIVTGYAILFKKPLTHLLLSSVIINLLTQSALWLALRAFFNHYLLTLLVAEVCIWLVEGALLRLYPYNRLNLREALGLSLAMNLTSFALGWLLPV
jgi:hypothetical protein